MTLTTPITSVRPGCGKPATSIRRIHPDHPMLTSVSQPRVVISVLVGALLLGGGARGGPPGLEPGTGAGESRPIRRRPRASPQRLAGHGPDARTHADHVRTPGAEPGRARSDARPEHPVHRRPGRSDHPLLDAGPPTEAAARRRGSRAVSADRRRLPGEGVQKAARAKGFILETPRIKTYRRSVKSPCGKFGQRGAPAYYCSPSKTIYWPLSGDDRSEAYTFARLGYVGLLAHEFGHHLQAVTGMLGEYGQRYARAKGRSDRYLLSRRLELQAQCFEGVFLTVAERDLSVDRRRPLSAAALARLHRRRRSTGEPQTRPRNQRRPDPLARTRSRLRRPRPLQHLEGQPEIRAVTGIARSGSARHPNCARRFCTVRVKPSPTAANFDAVSDNSRGRPRRNLSSWRFDRLRARRASAH